MSESFTRTAVFPAKFAIIGPMKIWISLFFIFLGQMAFAEQVRYLPAGTTFVFRQNIPLNDGQTGLVVGNKKCWLHLDHVGIRSQYLPYRSQLIVEEIEVKESEEGISPYSGYPYRTIPEIIIRFENTKMYMECNGDDAWDMDASEFQIDGLFDVLPPYHSYQTFFV
ncbi:MAG: hypothetical protein EP326_15290 [Deltaproteobacteria bacterium]|nr:MAG: hypothetical protein EP326_15290 [Deltaproteobacteria bacterium]